MKRYELKEITSEVRKLYEGCSHEEPQDIEPRLIKAFDDADEAIAALNELGNSDVREFRSSGGYTFYKVTEYIVEENEYEDDILDDPDESNSYHYWINGGDIWESSKFSDEDIETFGIR